MQINARFYLQNAEHNKKNAPRRKPTNSWNNQAASPERFAPFSREDFERGFAIQRARKMRIIRNEYISGWAQPISTWSGFVRSISDSCHDHVDRRNGTKTERTMAIATERRWCDWFEAMKPKPNKERQTGQTEGEVMSRLWLGMEPAEVYSKMKQPRLH